MAITRRELLIGLPALGLSACGLGQPSGPKVSTYQELAHAPGDTTKRLIVFMPDTRQTRDVWTGMTDEFNGEFDVRAVRIESSSDVESIRRGIERYKPSAAILMNNPTVAAFRRYEQSAAAKQRLPSFVVMASFLGQRQLGPQTTGIAYEVPLITVVTRLRQVLATAVDRVGVIHRPGLRTFVERQQELAAVERIRLVKIEVSARPNESEIKSALRSLKSEANVIWVLNDDRLLTPRLISAGWLIGLNERPFRPTIVGAASLISSAHAFGTFALLPDHVALGAQTASLVFDMEAESWAIDAERLPDLPLSTTTIIDYAMASERFQLRKDALEQVDVIV